MINIECQMIVRRERGFGEKMFAACLKEIYADKFVIVDNDCVDVVKDIYNTLIPKDKLTVVEISGRHPFDDLRNAGMDKTNSDCDWACFVDSDELFGKELFDEAREAAEQGANTCNVALSHLCVAPCLIDSSIHHFHPRFFKKLPGAKFSGKLHEGPAHVGPTKMLKTHQIHFGYCFPQWSIFLRWVWYNFLQDGHLDGLKLFLMENPTKTPGNFMQHSKSLKEYTGPWRALTPLVKKYGLTQTGWFTYLESVEDYSLWERWQNLAQDKGNWMDTLDIMLEFVYGVKSAK